MCVSGINEPNLLLSQAFCGAAVNEKHTYSTFAEHLPVLPLKLDSRDYEFTRRFRDHVNLLNFTPPVSALPTCDQLEFTLMKKSKFHTGSVYPKQIFSKESVYEQIFSQIHGDFLNEARRLIIAGCE